jgi:hypothetical protein
MDRRLAMTEHDIKIIKYCDWEHMDCVSQSVLNISQICSNKKVALIKVTRPEEEAEIQLICTNRGRILTIHGK